MALTVLPTSKKNQVEMECLVKRTISVLYDNGLTPSSSSNTAGTRPDFVRFSWSFESLGWETDRGTLGVGDTIGPYTGWSPQLQGWVSFGETHYGDAEHNFNVNPAPTWRAWTVESCNPRSQFGKWELQRLDGPQGVYTIYPMNLEVEYDYCYIKEICDDKGNKIEIQWYQAADDDTFELIETPEDADCYVSKDFAFPDPILEGAESNCEVQRYYVCDTANDDTQLILFIYTENNQEKFRVAHTLDDYNNATDPEIPEYDLSNAELVNVNPETGEKSEPFVEPCFEKNFQSTECRESQEYTYALDNTGTQTNFNGQLEIFVSDGTSFFVDQTNQGYASQWTPQMGEWGANIQTAADAAGYLWFVETRFIAGSGSLTSGGGFSGPPSETVSVALWDGGIRARYVNIQVCPGQPVPTRAIFRGTDNTDPRYDEVELTTAGAVLGPVNRFEVCTDKDECGTEVNQTWFIYDDGILRPASTGELPNCWEPCGTLALTDGPPDRECQFVFAEGCDSNNSENLGDFTQDVTRRATICDGEQIAVAYFIPDPDDTTSLVDYDLNGEFVDCATGEPIPEPELPCEEKDFSFTICATPKQYANLITINGAGQLNIYDQISGQWTNYGQVTKPDGSGLGSFSMDVLNDATNPQIIIQSSGELFSLSIDPDTCEPLSTEAREIGSHANSSFSGSYPVGAFKPGTEDYYVALGSGSTLGIANVNTGVVTTLGQLTDTRDGAAAQMGFGDAFFDPSGKFYGFAKDTRGATFGTTTGTILWCIDPVALTADPVGINAAPSSGTGAAWVSAGVYALSTSSGQVYYYRASNDTVLGASDVWSTEIPNAPTGINDLGNLWKRPETISVFVCGVKCGNEIISEEKFQIVQNDDGTSDLVPFTLNLPLDWGKCEPDANPYITDPFDSAGGSSNPKPVDKNWSVGCYDGGAMLWREDCDGFFEYRYGAPAETSLAAPDGFLPYECGTVFRLTDTRPFCATNSDGEPLGTVYQQEETQTGNIVWFDETGEITEPEFKQPGDCPPLDDETAVGEQIVCINDSAYIRRRTDNLVQNADGLLEPVNYEVIIFNSDGTLYTSGITPIDQSVSPAEPEFTVGDCVAAYITTERDVYCEIPAKYLLLIDSGGGFARYSFLTETWSNVSTLSVSSAGGSADVENRILYNFVAPDQITRVDVNTDTQLPAMTVIDGIINPSVVTNPKTFSAASFRETDGKLYAQDTAGADAGLYCINVNADPSVVTATVDFVTAISGVAGTGTSIMIDNSTDTLIVNGTTLSYNVDWTTGTSTVWGNPPIQPNGGTFDTNGNAYVTSSTDTYCLQAGLDPNDPSNWNQIIDDWGPGANSIAYYEVDAPQPPEFECRYGILENGDRVLLGTYETGCGAVNVPRTVVGEVVSCDYVERELLENLCDKQEATNDLLQEMLEPDPECSDFEYVGQLWKLDDSAEVGTLVEWWAGANWPPGANSAPHDTPSNIFTNDGSTLIHPNGAPSASYIAPTINFVTSQAEFLNGVGAANTGETNGTDQVKLSGYLVLTESALLSDTNDNTGERGGIWINPCCSDELTNLFERTTDSIGGDARMFEGVRVPAGIHYFEIATSDLSAWQGAQLSVSFDDGATYEPFVGYNSKPSYECIPVIKCKDTGELLNAIDQSILVVGEFDTWCEPKGCSSSDSSDATSTSSGFDCTTEETLSIENGTGNIPAGLKTVTINNITGTTTIAGGFELGAGRRVDAISLDATNHPCINGVLPAIALSGGTWQWIGIR